MKKIENKKIILKFSVALAAVTLVAALGVGGYYLYVQSRSDNDTIDTDNSSTYVPDPANTATDKKEEDLPKVEPDPDADPVKAPEGSLLEGKTLAPPPATD